MPAIDDTSLDARGPGFTSFETIHQCPLCFHSSSSMYFEPDIHRCNSCGVSYRNPRPTLQAIKESLDESPAYARWQTEDKVRNSLWAKRLHLVNRYVDGGKLLDVGTGDGKFFEFAEKSFDVVGTEISKAALQYVASRSLNVLFGDLDELGLASSSFDAITMWHVLEHFTEPGRYLRRAVDLLKPGGALFIAVPNELVPIWKTQLGLRGSYFGPISFTSEIHITHFTEPVLRRFLRSLGLVVLASGVDDVHVERPIRTMATYHLARAVHAVSGVQLDTAFFIVARKPAD
jgi:2-polyprenyl-3-methyl-5-hydroxy-6-metoxy-1,4-benzoquinol methylase